MARATNKKPAGSTKPKLTELKKEVYLLARVNSTKKLKGLRSEFALLDFRRSASWKSVLTTLQEEQSFEEWRDNPPEKYREMFTEIEGAAKESDVNLVNAENAFQKLEDSVNELNKLTEETKKEVDGIRREKVVSIPFLIPEKDQ